jgi:hypothetical protein
LLFIDKQNNMLVRFYHTTNTTDTTTNSSETKPNKTNTRGGSLE